MLIYKGVSASALLLEFLIFKMCINQGFRGVYHSQYKVIHDR